MKLHVVSALFVGCILATAACSDDSEWKPDPTAYSVSYRNRVRVPGEGAELTADEFATQLRTRDPVSSIRCQTDETPAFKDITTFLGGIGWTHPVQILKDRSFPPLFDSKLPVRDDGDMRMSADEGAGSNAAAPAGAPPTIERPDLVGVRNGIAVFLAARHGLLAVDLRSGAPKASCSMKLPGEPKNFMFQGNELVVVVNARGGHNRAALLRYSIDGDTFRFVDAVRLENQIVQDARLFDSTIVAYTTWSKPRPAPQRQTGMPSPVYGGGYGYGGGDFAGERGAAAPAYMPGQDANALGTKVIVVRWDKELGIDWEDSLLDDPVKQDPMEGIPEGKQYKAGEVVSTRTSWKTFVAASDRYLAVPREVSKTRFVSYQTYTYQVCTNYNPQAEQVESCSVQYEKRDNPDYRPPNPTTGDYACNGKSLADCIQEAAPSVSQHVYVPVGQSCQMVWRGRCEKYEQRSTTYPVFDTQTETELTIYRFENESFTKLDGTLAKMVKKNDAIAFEKEPLSVKGSISRRDQVKFQNGHLYMFADGALQTMAIAGNSLSYVNRLDVPARTENPAVAFSNDRAMISASGGYYNGSYNGSLYNSEVAMIDLSTPSIPTLKTSFMMPGQTTQLILTAGGILGPGQVSFTHGQVPRNLQKLTLFSKDKGAELDNLLLGTEYNTFESSWFSQDDDQRIRLGGDRLFLPYSGRHHADPFEPTAHRLNITKVENGRLVSERSFDVDDEIIRTAPIDDNRSLVFGNSATYVVDKTSGAWTISTLRELFVPFATYRLNDAGDIYARISRVGTKCLITTHAGDMAIFGGAHLAEATIACSEQAAPFGLRSNILFTETRTGVKISPDGKSIEPLAAADVEGMSKEVAPGFCWIEGAPERWQYTVIEHLDAVPGTVICRSSF